MSFIKDNGGPIVIAGIALAIIAGYTEWRIAANVDTQFQAAGLVSPDKVDAMEDDIGEVKGALVRIDGKIDRIVDILLED